jgi:hypothetical protein
VLFIGTQFSILYTSMYSPAGAAMGKKKKRPQPVLLRVSLFSLVPERVCCLLVLNLVSSTHQIPADFPVGN